MEVGEEKRNVFGQLKDDNIYIYWMIKMLFSNINFKKTSWWWKKDDENIAKVLLMTNDSQEKRKKQHTKNSIIKKIKYR